MEARTTAAQSISAGTAILFRASNDLQKVEAPDCSGHLVAATGQLKKIKILVICLYMVDGVGFNEENRLIRWEAAKLVILLDLPAIIGGDMNMTPTEIMASGGIGKLCPWPVAPLSAEHIPHAAIRQGGNWTSSM